MLARPRLIADPDRRHGYALAVALILLVSTALRLWQLGTPAEMMFDEIYYAKDAKAIVDGRVGTDGQYRWAAGDEVSWPHPEMGKFAIATGILLFGDRSFGWRLPAVIAGIGILACVYPLGRRLGLSPPWALLALLFAAADPLGHRAVAHRDARRLHRRVDGALHPPGAALRPGRLAHALALRLRRRRRHGASAPSGPARSPSSPLRSSSSSPGWRSAARSDARPRTPATRRRDRREPRGTAPSARRSYRLDAEAVAPARARGLRVAPHRRHGRALSSPCRSLVYLLSYTQYFLTGHTLADFRELHRQMMTFNLNLKATHTYASLAPTWIVDYRPVWYYFEGVKTYHGVIAIGNPFLWWLATLSLVAAAVLALLRRSVRAAAGRGPRARPVRPVVPHHADLVPVLHDPGGAVHGHPGGHGALPVRRRGAAAQGLAGGGGRRGWPRRCSGGRSASARAGCSGRCRGEPATHSAGSRVTDRRAPGPRGRRLPAVTAHAPPPPVDRDGAWPGSRSASWSRSCRSCWGCRSRPSTSSTSCGSPAGSDQPRAPARRPCATR